MRFLLFTAALASASPLAARQKTPADYPPRIFADAFTLIANVTSPTPNPLFNPHGWVLTAERVGAGQNAVVLSAKPAAGAGAVLFLNGTARDVSAENTSIMAPPLNNTSGPIPMGLQYASGAENRLVRLGINFGVGTLGTGIGVGLRDPYARLFAPAAMQGGRFIVCKEPNPVYTRPEFPVYWARYGVSEIPENCEQIALLAQCAKLPELVGEKELSIVKIGVGCYEDVKSIDWSKW